MKKQNKERSNQTELSAWITKDLQTKSDFVTNGQELHKVLEAYPTVGEIVRILSQHAPQLVEGVYAKAFDKNGKLLRDVLVTTNIEWYDDLEDKGLIKKKEIIPKHERIMKWLMISTPTGKREIRVPGKTERVEFFTKKNNTGNRSAEAGA